MRGLSNHVAHYRPIEINSRLTIEWSERNTCFKKRLGISDEYGRILIGIGNLPV